MGRLHEPKELIDYVVAYRSWETVSTGQQLRNNQAKERRNARADRDIELLTDAFRVLALVREIAQP